MRDVPQLAVDFVKGAEACKLVAYQDVGGVWTIGFGHTGPEVMPGLKITPVQAESDLRKDLEIAARRLALAVNESIILQLTDHQYSALLSFVFNLGCDNGWTIWKLLNAGKFDQVPAQLNRFVNAGGKKVQGLVNRRAAEVVLWSTSEPGSVADEPSSASTRAADTPPTPAPVPKTGMKAQIVAGCGLVGSACASWSPQIKGAADQLATFAGSPIIAHVAEGMMTVAGIALVVSMVTGYLQKRAAHQ